MANVGLDPWYGSWRDRVYLRDRSPSSDRDVLSSALIYASTPDVDLDPAVLRRDLQALTDIGRRAGLEGTVVCLDDASGVTEDVSLVEDVMELFDAVGGYSLLLAGLPCTADHFVEAASNCLSRFLPVWLRPFRGPSQVYNALTAPLSTDERTWLRPEESALLRDLLRLTGGHPYELMLAGHHLWLACKQGDQESYSLTPRVLDRMIPHLALFSTGGDALRDGAQAIERLPEDHVRGAVNLVAMADLTVREIAIARILKVDSRDADCVDRAILSASVDDEVERVLGELEQLADAGVIQVHADRERFSVVGGQAAAVLLKYKARTRIGADVSSQLFGLGFLPAVGGALARDAAVRTIEKLEGSSTLGFSAIASQDGAGRLSPRPGVRSLGASGNAVRLAQAEVDLVTWDNEGFDRVVELLTEPEPTIGLVYTALNYGREQLEYMELWELPSGVTHEDLARASSEVAEEWQPVVSASDLSWEGSEFAVLSGDAAREVLVVLQQQAATSAVYRSFDQWREKSDENALRTAADIADLAVQTLRATGFSDRELAGELSGMLSRAGFLKSFDEPRLEEARAALEEALRTGVADAWVTRWNLANVRARLGDIDGAVQDLTNIDQPGSATGHAYVLVHVPGRSAAESMVKVTHEAVPMLVNLQRAVLRAVAGQPNDVETAVLAAASSGDEGAGQMAKWVEQSIIQAAS